MNRNTKAACPVCERLVTIDGTTNGRGELILPWHIRDNWTKCAGSYRTLREATEWDRKRRDV